MGEGSSDLAGYCNTLILWMRKCSGYASHNVWMDIIMLQTPNVMLLQLQYDNRLDNSVTSEECQSMDGTFSIEPRVACPVANSCASSIRRQTT